MKFFLVLLVVLAVVIFVLLKRKASGGGRKVRLNHSRERNNLPLVNENTGSFRATVVLPCENACQAALDIKDEIFLDSEHNTPALPLSGCTQASGCCCKYAHEEDRRREDGDRRAHHKLAADLYSAEGADRRDAKRGRRSTD